MTVLHLRVYHDAIPCRCDNCDASFTSSEVVEIEDAHERLEPGCIVPVGECPHCGALAYYLDEDAPDHTAQAIGADNSEHLTEAVEALKAAEQFISGFEGDEMQEGIADLLNQIREAM